MTRADAFVRRVTAVLAFAAAALAGTDARADESVAIRLSEEGRVAFERKDFLTAADRFEAADREAPRGAVMFNAALSWDAAGDRARAATAFAAALARADMQPKEAAQAQKRLDELRRGLAALEIRAPAGATASVAHVAHGAVPLRVFVLPGQHRTVVTMPDGSSTERVVEAPAGKETVVALEPRDLPPPRAPSSATPSGQPDPASTDSTGSTRRIAGVVLAGGGLVLGGVALGIGLRAVSARDEYVASGTTNRDLYDEAYDLRLAANVLAGAAVVAGIAGVILFFTAPSAKKDAARALAGRLSF